MSNKKKYCNKIIRAFEKGGFYDIDTFSFINIKNTQIIYNKKNQIIAFKIDDMVYNQENYYIDWILKEDFL